MIPSTLISSLSEQSAECLLSNGLDRELLSDAAALITENALSAMWNNLKTKVPETAIGLQSAISDIENKYALENPRSHPVSRFFVFFRQLAKTFSPEFEEAGISLNNRVSCSWSEYTLVQNALEKKWSDEAVLKMWNDTGCNLSNAFEQMGASRRKPIPEQPEGIRTWLNRSRSKVYLKQVTKIDFSKLSIRLCPLEIHRFLALETLNLSSNQLRVFNLDLSPCKNLKNLILFSNEIRAFIPNLSSNSKLERLELSNNRLSQFSTSLQGCPKLKWVNLSFNKIEEFSSDMKSLTKIETLNLSFNKLRAPPNNFLPDKKPKRLILTHNLFQPKTPPGFRRSARTL